MTARLLQPLDPTDPATPTARRVLHRALLFGGALLMLWVATLLMPKPEGRAAAETARGAFARPERSASQTTLPADTLASTAGRATPRADTAATRLAALDAPPALGRREAPRVFGPRYFLVLALLGAGGALALYLRRRRGTPGRPTAPLESVGQLQLAPGQTLRLVACGDEVLLLGATNGQISLLKAFPRGQFEAPPTDAPPTEALDDAEPAAASPSFAAVLRQAVPSLRAA